MLDPRIYRGALLLALLAVIVVAFSLENRPEPIRTSLAPAAFEGARAERLLERLAAEYPSRRPGSISSRSSSTWLRCSFTSSGTWSPSSAAGVPVRMLYLKM